jgi:hypothetical protein
LLESEIDKIEVEKEQEVTDWIEEEERKEKEAESLKNAQKEADDQWMIDQLKKEHGENFGDDINMDFSD